jgi:hypothetical protein
MAGNRDGYGVGGAGPGYGPRGLRHADLLRYRAVGAGFTARNSLQAFPDAPLKSGGANVERQGTVGLCPFESVARGYPSMGPWRHRRGGEQRKEIRASIPAAVVDRSRRTEWHKCLCRWRRSACVPAARRDGVSGPPRRPRRAGIFPASCQVAWPCARKDGCWSRIRQHRARSVTECPCLQILLHLAEPAGVDVGLGRHAQHRFERPLQMKGAAAEFSGQLAERNAVFDMLLDVAAHRPDQRGSRISVHGLGTAAQTGAIAGLFRRSASSKKFTLSRRGRLAGHDGRQKIRQCSKRENKRTVEPSRRDR